MKVINFESNIIERRQLSNKNNNNKNICEISYKNIFLGHVFFLIVVVCQKSVRKISNQQLRSFVVLTQLLGRDEQQHIVLPSRFKVPLLYRSITAIYFLILILWIRRRQSQLILLWMGETTRTFRPRLYLLQNRDRIILKKNFNYNKNIFTTYIK